MKTIFLLIFIVVPSLFAQIMENDFKSEAGLITQESLMEKVEALSSNELKGRLSGSEGYNKASEYVKKYFTKLGLKPAFGTDYYQKLFVEYNEIKSPARFCLVKDSNIWKEFKLGDDYIFRGFTGSGDFTAPVVFCGYGISNDVYDDYKNVNVNGKVVIVFKQNPTWELENIKWGNSYPREKAEIAAIHGAIGLIMVSRPLDTPPQPVIASVMHGKGEQRENFPQLHISIDAANEFLSGSGYDIKDIQRKIDEGQKPLSFELSASALIKVQTDYYKEKETQNIAAILEGNDEELKNEYVIIGAHLDHVGSQSDEVYFPGANDNASGSAGVMQIAEAFIKSGVNPKRSIIFTLFTSEEQGLIGAEYFVENPPVDLENVVAMLNMDCIGSGDSIQIGNGKSAPILWNIFRETDLANDNLMLERTWAGGGADATPFHEKGIPIAYIVSHYSYEHLHLPTDSPETLNKDLYKSIVDLSFLSLQKIANGEYVREKLVQ